MLYKHLLRPFLFLFEAETIHHWIMSLLRWAGIVPGGITILRTLFEVQDVRLERKVAGITFPNPVGLAAGFDKDAKAYKELGALGFGFVEIGTVTPLGQPGNPKPRLFRLPADKALINRMGFNNEGVKAAALRLENRTGRTIIGGNIGKNKDTLNENAVSDYLFSFKELFPFVDYFVINISSPNTPGLRALQEKEPLLALLHAVQIANQNTGKAKPVFLKIAPDLTLEQADDIVEIVISCNLSGVIISNTTVSRAGLNTSPEKLEEIGAGGLSGQPVLNASNELLKYVADKSKKKFSIIASGGIFSAEDALEKLRLGADLVQLYTGFIYEGPGLIKKINKALLKG